MKSGVAWRRASRGLNLIGLGCFLLATTQGVLPWSFWIDAARLWPLLLVAIGLRMIVERTAPWAVLASPLLVQGTLLWVAFHPTPRVAPVFASGDWSEYRIERPEDAREWTLDAELALTQLEVRAAEGEAPPLVEGRSAGPGRGSVMLARAGEAPRVRVRGHKSNVALPWRAPDEAWELRVAEDLPLRVDLELAFASGPIDLHGAPLTRLDLEGAFNELTLALPAPQEEVRLRLEGAFNDFAIEIPAGVPVRRDVQGLLNEVAGSLSAGSGAPGYRLELDGLFNTVVLRER